MARYLSGGVRDEEVEADVGARSPLRGPACHDAPRSIQHLHLVPGSSGRAPHRARNGIMGCAFARAHGAAPRREGHVRRSWNFFRSA